MGSEMCIRDRLKPDSIEQGNMLPILNMIESSGFKIIALKYKRENFIRILTEAKMDESPSVAPNGNMVIYGIKEKNLSMLAGFSLSGAKFKLPASSGEVREPAWSNFLR